MQSIPYLADEAELIICSLKDFSGDVSAWRESYFKLLSWKNTFDRVYSLDILAGNNHEPFVQLLLRDVKQVESTVSYLEDLGYGGISCRRVQVAVVSPLDLDSETEFLVTD